MPLILSNRIPRSYHAAARFQKQAALIPTARQIRSAILIRANFGVPMEAPCSIIPKNGPSPPLAAALERIALVTHYCGGRIDPDERDAPREAL
ncbi:MAG: hypothetical protein GC154_18070 [bacterium]|nr:hypothetical protein [bacterium]